MEVKEIRLEQIRGTAFTVRAEPDEVSQELLDSIKEHGVKQPILLRRKDDFYEIVAGTRRVAACRKLGLQTIPSVLEVVDDKTAFELALTENLQRKTLSPFEEAQAFLAYLNNYHWGTITELARKISKSPSYIVNRLKLVELPEKVRQQLFSGERFSVSHADEVLRLAGEPEKMEELARVIVENGLDRDKTREVVELVKDHDIPINRAVETVKATSGLRERAQLVGDQARRSLIEAEPHKAKRIVEIADEGLRSVAKRLELFPERSLKMEPKFEQLAMWEERGIIPYTIWDFTYRDGYAGDKDFHGNCSPQIVEQCIWRFTEEGELVVDPMAGSGTAVDVCKRFNRKCVAYDINPTRPDIKECDSRKTPLDSNTVDMIFIHPPVLEPGQLHNK
ncbi:Nucleoid occlusion protein [subsurface metagenome]